MIGRLKGRLLERQPPQLLVDVGGVGYEVEAPMTTFFNLPEIGHEITLYTHLVVREDAHLLFGFHRKADRSLFRTLIKVNGVGARTALGILSGMSGADLIRCIQQEDIAALVRLPGIGKKTAERLIVELRDRLKEFDESGSAGLLAPVAAQPPEGDNSADAVSALVALGYKSVEAQRMVKAIAKPDMTSDTLIRLALQSQLKGVGA